MFFFFFAFSFATTLTTTRFVSLVLPIPVLLFFFSSPEGGCGTVAAAYCFLLTLQAHAHTYACTFSIFLSFFFRALVLHGDVRSVFLTATTPFLFPYSLPLFFLPVASLVFFFSMCFVRFVLFSRVNSNFSLLFPSPSLTVFFFLTRVSSSFRFSPHVSGLSSRFSYLIILQTKQQQKKNTKNIAGGKVREHGKALGNSDPLCLCVLSSHKSYVLSSRTLACAQYALRILLAMCFG